MKLSYDWLSDFVDLSGLTPEEVAEKLTMGAFEVEEIKFVGPDITGEVVVGEIIEINPHPDPEVTKIRMTKTRVKEGAEPLDIVCGAWNIEPGQKIPVALPGSKVINRKDGSELPIKLSTIRGATSNGMLCSPPELGVEGNGEGILILDASTKIGSSIQDLLNIKRDAILHVEPRSNRGDALCVLGLAREVAALFGRPLRMPEWKLPETAATGAVNVELGDQEDCPFFTVRTVTGLTNGPSPSWMVRRLEAVGMRSVSSIVDITNYVMHELGQPLHAYDMRQMSGNKLVARRALKGETLETLDEKKRDLNEEVLVIADGERVLGIAGVMGGKNSEVADDTADIALEAAAFNSARVRRSSRMLGLSSDSSLRFERGVDAGTVKLASDRAAFLLVQNCGGKLGAFSSAGSDETKLVQVTLRMSEIARLTEIALDGATVEKLLTPLGFKVSDNNQNSVSVTIPSYRLRDVSREADLVEEVVRLYGYDKVPVSMPKRTVAPPLPNYTVPRIKEALAASGLNEAWISSLVAQEDLTGRGAFTADDAVAVRMLNPLSEEHQLMRLSLLPGLLKAVSYNQDRGRADVWLFETGLTYEKDSSTVDRSGTGTRETPRVSAIIAGESVLSVWDGQKSTRPTDFYLMKGVLENLLQRLCVPADKVGFVVESDIPKWFHPSRSCRVQFKKHPRDKSAPVIIGWLGEIHPAVAESYGLKKPACAFELNIDSLQAAMQPQTFEEIITTPPILRDLTTDVNRSVAHADVVQNIRQTGGKLLRDVELVSIFDLSDNLKSLSYRLTFQAPDQTLKSDDIDNNVMAKIRDQLTKSPPHGLSATFRT